MFKFLIILILIIYTFYKVAGFFFRLVFGNLRSDPGSFKQRPQSHKAHNSNLNIDKIPLEQSRSKTEFKGGEYVDFEEVK